ncbi:hypothetical protein ACA910_006013 [Epithemia clementina (nom. ined.)]
MPAVRRMSGGNRSNSLRSNRSNSFSSADGSQASHGSNSKNNKKRSKHRDGKLPPPILVYHESAHSIVFRDHLRRVAKRQGSSNLSNDDDKNEQRQPQQSASPNGTTTKSNHTKKNSDIPKSHGQAAMPDGTTPAHRHDTLIEVATEFTHIVGIDQGETVMPSQAQIPVDQIANFRPRIQPLPALALGPDDQFESLLKQPPAAGINGINESENVGDTQEGLSPAEQEVVHLLQTQKACVKTVRNGDWTAFLTRFETPQPNHGKWCTYHMDVPPHDGDEFPFNSFVTSTTLLPENGKKMRCFGALSQFTVGVVFALPGAHCNPNPQNGQDIVETEEEASKRTRTWSWPAGYSAKTEFNIDGRGNLTNGREEALTPLSVLRQYNREYVHDEEYTVAGRKISGLSQIPYNEVFLRVGGRGRIVRGRDCASGKIRDDAAGTGRSFDHGVGLPIALFVRLASFGHLVSLLRTRSRCCHVLGEAQMKDIPLLLITPEEGTRVLTERLQVELWKVASQTLNPFQNPALARRTTIDNMDEASFQQKVDELFDLDRTIREKLTPDELARLAGGFGATDQCVADILKQIMLDDIKVERERRHCNNEEHKDKEQQEESHHLQDFVNEGLTAAVRSGDFLTARQLLILYSVVATRKEEMNDADDESLSDYSASECRHNERSLERLREVSLGKDAQLLVQDLELIKKNKSVDITADIPPPPPPPPLDTDRLRGATNSDGLLAVLGAAQILKAMQDGGAKRRTEEVVDAVDDWCKHGEQSMAFRISSWYDQRAAQGDLQIATENDSNFMAFVSNKAIANRRTFAEQLRQAVSSTDFADVRFLRAIEEMVSKMHAPCLRLELLQYVLGLDNRFSVSHVGRAVHLAATCLGVSAGTITTTTTS